MFSLRAHFVSVCWQVKFPNSGHATKVANTWASDQKIDNTVSKY